jgi:hypothetical protein
MRDIKQILLLSLWWVPRISGIIFALFLAVFSLDVFGQGTPVWKTALALLIHNIPTIVILTVIVFSWKRSWLGAVSFLILCIVSFFLMPAKSKSLLIVLPLIGVGVLFFLNWLLRAEIKRAKKSIQENLLKYQVLKTVPCHRTCHTILP